MTELETLRIELDTITRDRNNLQRQLEEAHKLELMNAAALDAVTERNTELEAKLADLEGTVGTREAELGQAHARIEELDRSRLQGIKMCDELQNKVFCLQSDISYRDGRIEGLQSGGEMLRDQLRAREAEITRLHLRPPMHCTTCEVHNENLCELITIMESFCRTANEEFEKSAQGWGAPMLKAFGTFRRRIRRLPKPLDALFATITKYGAGDPVESEEEFQALLTSIQASQQATPLDTPAREVIEEREPTPEPEPMENRYARDLIERDVVILGTGFGRLHPDGRLEHIPAAEVLVHHAPNAVTPASKWGETILELLKKMPRMQIGVDMGAPEGDRTVIATGTVQDTVVAIKDIWSQCPKCGSKGSALYTDRNQIGCVVCGHKEEPDGPQG